MLIRPFQRPGKRRGRPRVGHPRGRHAAKQPTLKPNVMHARTGACHKLDTAINSSCLVSIKHRHAGRLTTHVWMGFPKLTAMAASLTASLSVGWPWHVRAMSSVHAPYSIASTHSAMSSPALGPMIQAPSSLSVLASLMNLTWRCCTLAAGCKCWLQDKSDAGLSPVMEHQWLRNAWQG